MIETGASAHRSTLESTQSAIEIFTGPTEELMDYQLAFLLIRQKHIKTEVMGWGKFLLHFLLF